jgi:hypothetical protein
MANIDDPLKSYRERLTCNFPNWSRSSPAAWWTRPTA